MMKAGPHTNPAAPARHRPPSPPPGTTAKPCSWAPLRPCARRWSRDAESGCRGLELPNARRPRALRDPGGRVPDRVLPRARLRRAVSL